MTVISKTPPPVKADPNLFGAPCPQPVMPVSVPEDAATMVQGVQMRDNPAEWAFVRLSKMIEAFEAGTDDADFDKSGFVDIVDFSEFVLRFEIGC